MDPLGVQLVTLGILRARRDAPERAGYAARLVRAAAAAADASDVFPSVRPSLGSALTRRALLHGRASTWVPVVGVDRTCIGVLRCGRCIDACPEQALEVSADAPGGPPRVRRRGAGHARAASTPALRVRSNWTGTNPSPWPAGSVPCSAEVTVRRRRFS